MEKISEKIENKIKTSVAHIQKVIDSLRSKKEVTDEVILTLQNSTDDINQSFGKVKNYSTGTKGFGLKLLEQILNVNTDNIKSSFKESNEWVICNGESQPSDFLIQGFERIDSIISINLEASHRMVIDLLLMEALEKFKSKPQLKLRLGERFTFESGVIEDGRFVQITQEPDYTIFYADGNDCSHRFFIEAKQELVQKDVSQVVAQMGIVYALRKRSFPNKESCVFGAIASAFEIQFYKLDNHGIITRTEKYKIVKELKRVLFIMDYILQEIVITTPTVSRVSSVGELAEGVKTISI